MDRISCLRCEVDFMNASDSHSLYFMQPQELCAVVITTFHLKTFQLAGEWKRHNRRIQTLIFSASMILFARYNRVR